MQVEKNPLALVEKQDVPGMSQAWDWYWRREAKECWIEEEGRAQKEQVRKGGAGWWWKDETGT